MTPVEVVLVVAVVAGVAVWSRVREGRVDVRLTAQALVLAGVFAVFGVLAGLVVGAVMWVTAAFGGEPDAG